MLQQRFWRSLCIGLSAVLLVVPSVFIRAKAETSTLGYWVVTAEAAGLNDQSQTMYNYVLHIYTMHDDARGNVSGTYQTMGGNNQSFSNVVFYGRETTVSLYSGATNTIGNTIRGNGTFSYVYSGEETVIEFSQDQWDEITQHFNDMATAMNGLNENIDTIGWIDANPDYILGYSTSKNGTYSYDSISTNQSDIYMKVHVNAYNDNRLIKLQTDITTSGRTSGNAFMTNNLSYTVYRTDAEQTRQVNAYLYTNGAFLTLYVYSNIGTTSTVDLIFKIHQTTDYPSLRVNSSQNNRYTGYIDSNNIEYWQLMYYLSELTNQSVIINNQQTIINQQSSSQQYNQQQYDTNNNEEQTDDIEGFMVDYDNKLGFIGQSFDFITSLFGVITNADASSTIPFPGVTVPIGEGGSNVTLIQAQNVDIVPSGLSSIFEYVRLANSMIIVSAVFNMAINKYKEWSMK